MPYHQLNEKTVINYLKSINSLSDLVTKMSTATEIGNDNLNFVYIISNLKDGMKLVLKQSAPHLRCANEYYHLTKERMHFEAHSMELFSKLIPQHLPRIYHVDTKMALMVMQCLDSHITMRKGLIAKTTYPKFLNHITDYLAHSLFKTSSLYLNGKEKRQLMKNYVSNDELCKITEDFVFSTSYMQHETNPENSSLKSETEAMKNDVNFKHEILSLKNKFMNQTDALLHGDLHTGSIMINENETIIIDSEFAFFGPIGFDVGSLIANLILAWISHFERSQDGTYQAWLLETTLAVYSQFEIKFLNLWDEQSKQESGLILKGFCSTETLKKYQNSYMKQILQDSIGFAGLNMARRILDIEGIADIRDIPDPSARSRAEKLSLSIAKRLVMQRQNIENISDILPILKEESARHEYAVSK